MPAVDNLSSGETSPFKGPAPKAAPEDTSLENEDIMPLTSPGDQPVQFIPAQPINGDAKVEIGNAGGTPAFVGLGKEELMKYANDPFWVRLRWFLFILFWALWVAMLAGAIVIILMAPKCAEKKAPAETYYQLNVQDGNIEELGKNSKYLSDHGVSAVIITDILKKDNLGFTEDFKNVDEKYGTLSGFTDAVKKLKDAGLRVLLTLVPNHSSTKHKWFTDDTHQYHDFYVHKQASEVSALNWRTVNNNQTSAWKQLDPTNSSTVYLQQFDGSADLNYLNEKVVHEMAGIFSFWKGKGVDAFVIPAGSYIVEDFGNSTFGNRNQPQNVAIIKTLLNKQAGEPHSIVEVNGLNDEDASKYVESGIVPLQDKYDYRSENFASTTLKKSFFSQQVQRNKYPVLRLSGSIGDLKREDQEEANIIRLLAFTSNISVVLHYDDGQGPDAFNSSSATTTFDYIKKLAEVSHTLIDPEGKSGFNHNYHGGNEDVMAFVRSEKYVIIANFGRENVTVEFGEMLSKIDSTAEVLIATPNAVELKPNAKFTRSVALPPRSAVLLEKIE